MAWLGVMGYFFSGCCGHIGILQAVRQLSTRRQRELSNKNLIKYLMSSKVKQLIKQSEFLILFERSVSSVRKALCSNSRLLQLDSEKIGSQESISQQGCVCLLLIGSLVLEYFSLHPQPPLTWTKIQIQSFLDRTEINEILP